MWTKPSNRTLRWLLIAAFTLAQVPLAIRAMGIEITSPEEWRRILLWAAANIILTPWLIFIMISISAIRNRNQWHPPSWRRPINDPIQAIHLLACGTIISGLCGVFATAVLRDLVLLMAFGWQVIGGVHLWALVWLAVRLYVPQQDSSKRKPQN